MQQSRLALIVPLLALAGGWTLPAVAAPAWASANVRADDGADDGAGWLAVPSAAPPTADPPHQVRIEQHMTIRISPGMPPDVILDMREDVANPRYVERGMSRCVALGGIAAVQGGEANRLILFMRDQKIVSATLEKACDPRDFYSGFYLTPQPDGMLCANRDTLQSRSGAHCRVRRLRALVDTADRR